MLLVLPGLWLVQCPPSVTLETCELLACVQCCWGASHPSVAPHGDRAPAPAWSLKSPSHCPRQGHEACSQPFLGSSSSLGPPYPHLWGGLDQAVPKWPPPVL
jgi:hypothetical protein